jgi:hypothetical protein
VTASPDSTGSQTGISTHGTTVSSGPTWGSDGTFGTETDYENSKPVPGTEHSTVQIDGSKTTTTTSDAYTGILVANSVYANEPDKGVCTKTEVEAASGTETNVTVRDGGKVVSSVTTGQEYDIPIKSTETCSGDAFKNKENEPKPNPSPQLQPNPELNPPDLQPDPILISPLID